jgi:hypothetical protein
MEKKFLLWMLWRFEMDIELKVNNLQFYLLQLINKDYKQFRILLVGVGDVRHALATCLDFYLQMENDLHLDNLDDVRIELHLNDVAPQMLARDILLLKSAFDLAEYSLEDIKEGKEDAVNMAFYAYGLWLAYNMPQPQYELFSNDLEKLIEFSE